MKPFIASVFVLLMVYVALRGFWPGLFGKKGSVAARTAPDYSDARDLSADASNHRHDGLGGGDSLP